MTDYTRYKYEQTLEKARMTMLPIQVGDCEAIDLLVQPEMHLLLLESFQCLCAVVVEGNGCVVEWV